MAGDEEGMKGCAPRTRQRRRWRQRRRRWQRRRRLCVQRQCSYGRQNRWGSNGGLAEVFPPQIQCNNVLLSLLSTIVPDATSRRKTPIDDERARAPHDRSV